MEKKNFKKLKTKFFLRLRNRGFKKYLLRKLFSKITYVQRNKLLNTKTLLPNICEPVTYQEAERRLLLEGEERFAQSQEDGVISAPLASACLTLNTVQLKDTGTGSSLQSAEEISFQSGITSLEGWILARFPSSPCFSY